MQKFTKDREAFQVLPIEYVSDIIAGDTTPTVLNCKLFTLQNAAPLSVTYFDDGAEGQTIKLLGDGFTTIVNGAALKVNIGANKLLLANIIYTFTLINGVWYENE